MSSQTPYQTPLIRRILPWIYAVIFFITAPLLIFYTSGYRYNFKKSAVERNGTLIVDSLPHGGTVFIDGQDSGEKTPVTFQQMTPGWHNVKVGKPGYTSWQQDVLIRAERVTFSDRVRLWRQGAPTLLSNGSYVRLASDPNRERLLAFEAASTTAVGWWSPSKRANLVPLALATSSIPHLSLRWREDSEGVLLGGNDELTQSWFVKASNNQTTIESLPAGRYHISGNALIGVNGSTLLNVDTDQNQIERLILSTNIREQSGSISLQTATSSDSLLLSDSSFLGRLFSLPIGGWSIYEWHRPFLFLADGTRWLGIRLHLGNTPDVMRAEGDYPRWSPDTKHPRAAFVDTHEIHLWSPDMPETVIWRQSTPILNAVWNDQGDVLYIADQQQVFALPIDTLQESHPVTLGQFDQVWDIATEGTTLYAVAKQGAQRGIFTIPAL